MGLGIGNCLLDVDVYDGVLLYEVREVEEQVGDVGLHFLGVQKLPVTGFLLPVLTSVV